MKRKPGDMKLPNWAVQAILLIVGIIFSWICTSIISLIALTIYNLLSPADITWGNVFKYSAYSGIAWTCYLVPKLDLTL